jgi:hypothetical protein
MELGQRHLSAVAGIFDNLTRSSGGDLPALLSVIRNSRECIMSR